MFNWTVRDWTSVIVGWIAGASAYCVVWEHQPGKIFIVFAVAFVSAWVARMLIPR